MKRDIIVKHQASNGKRVAQQRQTSPLITLMTLIYTDQEKFVVGYFDP